MCPSAPRVCSEPGGQRPVLSLSLDLIDSAVSQCRRKFSQHSFRECRRKFGSALTELCDPSPVRCATRSPVSRWPVWCVPYQHISSCPADLTDDRRDVNVIRGGVESGNCDLIGIERWNTGCETWKLIVATNIPNVLCELQKGCGILTRLMTTNGLTPTPTPSKKEKVHPLYTYTSRHAHT